MRLVFPFPRSGLLFDLQLNIFRREKVLPGYAGSISEHHSTSVCLRILVSTTASCINQHSDSQYQVPWDALLRLTNKIRLCNFHLLLELSKPQQKILRDSRKIQAGCVWMLQANSESKDTESKTISLSPPGVCSSTSFWKVSACAQLVFERKRRPCWFQGILKESRFKLHLVNFPSEADLVTDSFYEVCFERGPFVHAQDNPMQGV